MRGRLIKVAANFSDVGRSNLMSPAALLLLSFCAACPEERSDEGSPSCTFGNSIEQKNFNLVGMLVSRELNLILNLAERQQRHKQLICLK